MFIKERYYKNVEINSTKKNIKQELNTGETLIYFVKSFPFKTTLETKTLSLYSLFSPVNSVKQTKSDSENSEQENKIDEPDNQNSNEGQLSAPKRKNPLSFTEKRKNEDIFPKNQKFQQETEEDDIKEGDTEESFIFDSVSIQYFIECEGFVYRIKNLSHSISLKTFLPLCFIFDKKEAISKEQFYNLYWGDTSLSLFDIEEDKLHSIFKKGEIDLTINEIFNNRNIVTINNISMLDRYIMIDFSRLKGNQSMFYEIQDEKNINNEMLNCMQALTKENKESQFNEQDENIMKYLYLQYPKSDI